MWSVSASWGTVRNGDGRFIAWSRTVDFYGRWMPQPQELYGLYFGEIGWSSAFKDVHYDGPLGTPRVRTEQIHLVAHDAVLHRRRSIPRRAAGGTAR